MVHTGLKEVTLALHNLTSSFSTSLSQHSPYSSIAKPAAPSGLHLSTYPCNPVTTPSQRSGYYCSPEAAHASHSDAAPQDK